MQKILYNFLIFIFILTLSGCNSTKDQKQPPLTFPTLEPCTSSLINARKSYICINKINNSDIIETNIRFDTNSFKLNDESKEVLYKLFAYLKLSGSPAFTIRGYAGKIDSKLISNKKLLTEHNIRLSKNRAISVREYLVNKGLKPDRITIKALGYQDPVAPNDSSENRTLNQRVEISLKSRVLDQIDNIEGHLKHVYPAKYEKFFSNVYLLDDSQINDISKIYESSEKRPVLATGFKIFSDKEYPINLDGEPFTIITKPKSLESFYEDRKVYSVGTAKYDYTYKGVTAFTILNLTREAQVGDFIIPKDIVSKTLPEKTFRMKSQVRANILEDVVNTNTFSSSYNSILLNKGSTDGLKLGAEVIFYEPESRTDGFPIPPKFLGYGFIYRSSEHYAIALILNSLQEVTSKSMATTTL